MGLRGRRVAAALYSTDEDVFAGIRIPTSQNRDVGPPADLEPQVGSARCADMAHTFSPKSAERMYGTPGRRGDNGVPRSSGSLDGLE